MGRFRSQPLSSDNSWSFRYNIPENDRCSNSSGQRKQVSSYIKIENYGIKVVYDQIHKQHDHMYFCDISMIMNKEWILQILLKIYIIQFQVTGSLISF